MTATHDSTQQETHRELREGVGGSVTSRDAGGTRLLVAAGAALVGSGLWNLADEADSRLARDIADTAYYRAFGIANLVAFGLLAVALTVVARRRWAGNGPGSAVVLGVAALGALQAVGAMWHIAFATGTLAEVAPELVNHEEGYLAVGLGLALVSTAVGLLVLGIAALRAGRVRRVTGWLLVAAGVALAVLPGGHLVAGTALLVGRRDAAGD